MIENEYLRGSVHLEYVDVLYVKFSHFNCMKRAELKTTKKFLFMQGIRPSFLSDFYVADTASNVVHRKFYFSAWLHRLWGKLLILSPQRREMSRRYQLRFKE